MPQNKIKRESRSVEGESMRGIPGYRTRQDRTGFDPLDTSAESAHMEGLFLRELFALRLRTRNPLYLLMMFSFGPLFFFPILKILSDVIFYPGPIASDNVLIFLLVLGFLATVTGALTINFIKNILWLMKINPVSSPKNKKKPTKKQPSRRKDYK